MNSRVGTTPEADAVRNVGGQPVANATGPGNDPLKALLLPKKHCTDMRLVQSKEFGPEEVKQRRADQTGSVVDAEPALISPIRMTTAQVAVPVRQDRGKVFQ
jgi:hypothetical protein